MAWSRLGLIAGGGDLPVHVAEAARGDDRLGCVIALDGFAEPERYETAELCGIAQPGRALKLLAQHRCDAVCFAGIVKRPDFSKLKPDMKGVAFLPKAIAAAAKGDDALLRAVIGLFEDEGLAVVGVDDIAGQLLAPAGVLGQIEPDEAHRADASKAMEVASLIGSADIGQGAVVAHGLVLAVEAQEGTDAMLSRVGELPLDIRGGGKAPCGVLAKRPKPDQERRVDLPVIGLSTIQGAAQANLAGIAIPEGGALILGRKAVVEAADKAGLFIWGLSMDDKAGHDR
jgi:DUF1009 family protein